MLVNVMQQNNKNFTAVIAYIAIDAVITNICVAKYAYRVSWSLHSHDICLLALFRHLVTLPVLFLNEISLKTTWHGITSHFIVYCGLSGMLV